MGAVALLGIIVLRAWARISVNSSALEHPIPDIVVYPRCSRSREPSQLLGERTAALLCAPWIRGCLQPRGSILPVSIVVEFVWPWDWGYENPRAHIHTTNSCRLPVIPFIRVPMFCAAMAVIMSASNRDFKPTYFNFMRLLIGPPLKVREYESVAVQTTCWVRFLKNAGSVTLLSQFLVISHPVLS